MSVIRDYKGEAVAARTARRASYREKRRLERQCFWTWPWGHVWRWVDRIGLTSFYECEVCRKTKVDMWP